MISQTYSNYVPDLQAFHKALRNHAQGYHLILYPPIPWPVLAGINVDSDQSLEYALSQAHLSLAEDPLLVSFRQDLLAAWLHERHQCTKWQGGCTDEACEHGGLCMDLAVVVQCSVQRPLLAILW
jgi:hypothetical protein